ncbi:MAG: preprotein translocase subunit SecG [Bacteroidia bacterium]|nr:preprotein translocase subunit SecG [Bacteroidia bacterium]
MYILFGTLSIVLAIAMILVVIVQNSKGGGLSSTFGGSATQMLGARRGDEFIEKLTWYLAIGIVVFAFVANVSASSGTEVVQAPKIEDVINNPILAPTAPNPGQ